MTEEEIIWSLLAKKLAGEINGEESDELNRLLGLHPELHYQVSAVEELWMAGKGEEVVPPAKSEKAFRKLKKKLLIRDRTDRPLSSGFRFFVPPLFFRVAWRNLARGRAFSFINIIGLAIGMAAALFILLFIRDELGYDRFHRNKDRIYGAYSRVGHQGQIQAWGGSSMLLGPALEKDYPEIEATARANPVSAFIFHANNKHLESFGYLTDPAFLKIFDFPAISGNAETALRSPRSLVITRNLALKLFGKTDVTGEMVRIDSNANFIVEAVLENPPSQSSLNFEYLVPWSYMKEVQWDRPTWSYTDINTYVLLTRGVGGENVSSRIRNVVKDHEPESQVEVFLHPITKWRLWSYFENGEVAGGRIHTLRLFGVIAAFILLIACINYMNLSTARSVKRAREVGVRKVNGALRGSLIFQFLGESVLIALVAGAFSLLLLEYNLPWISRLIFKPQLSIPYTHGGFWMLFLGFILLTGLLAGSYPAFYLSSFKPASVLKGLFKPVSPLVTPRKIMVVVQFSFAIILIICTLVIHRQLKYGQQRSAGFPQENLAYVYLKGDMQKKYTVIREELFSTGAITGIMRTNSPVVQVWNGDNSYVWPGKDPEDRQGFIKFHSDGNFAKTLGLTVMAGRDLDPLRYPADSHAVLINEAAARRMGTDKPVGMHLKSDEGNWVVAGLVKDFIPGSPFAKEQPIVVQGPGKHHWYGTLTFRLNPSRSTIANLGDIQGVLKKYNPDYPFDYFFVSDSYAEKFEDEKRTGMLAGVFAALTIFISCLGLFALAAYMAENRIKEIGIRKVLGASVWRLIALLTGTFLKLIIVSFAVATPVAWWAMHSWLQVYSYRVSLGWEVFAFTGLLTLGIALLTVSLQAIKAARANPTKSLRTE